MKRFTTLPRKESIPFDPIATLRPFQHLLQPAKPSTVLYYRLSRLLRHNLPICCYDRNFIAVPATARYLCNFRFRFLSYGYVQVFELTNGTDFKWDFKVNHSLEALFYKMYQHHLINLSVYKILLNSYEASQRSKIA